MKKKIVVELETKKTPQTRYRQESRINHWLKIQRQGKLKLKKKTCHQAMLKLPMWNGEPNRLCI